MLEYLPGIYYPKDYWPTSYWPNDSGGPPPPSGIVVMEAQVGVSPEASASARIDDSLIALAQVDGLDAVSIVTHQLEGDVTVVPSLAAIAYSGVEP